MCFLLLFSSVLASKSVNYDFFWRCLSLPIFDNPAPIAVEASFADYLFANGFYLAAADEYDRTAKLQPMDASCDYATYQRALCLIRAGKISKAEYVLDRLGYTALDKEVSYGARLLRALLETASDAPERGEFLLSDVMRDFSEKADEIRYWRGWFRLLYYNIDGALNDFEAVCNTASRNPYYAPRAYGIRRWIDMNRNSVEQRSPYLARWLSGVMPGAGQIYIGNWRSGLNSLIINGILGYLTVDAILSHRYIQSITIFAFGWNRYYFGGLTNSELGASVFNRAQWDNALRALMDTFIGEPTKKSVLSDSSDGLPVAEKWLNGASICADLMLSLYQNCITNQDAQQCQFHPGCSKFARMAFRTKNPFTALLMTSDRLQRCNPFARKYYTIDASGYLIDPRWATFGNSQQDKR